MEAEILERIGLTKGEVRVYLALLELGQTTSGPIIERSGISGSKTYEILKKLMRKGLASCITKEKTKHFQAAPPRKILEYLEEREKGLAREKKALESFLPRLEALQKAREAEPSATVYEGVEGTKTVFNNRIERLKEGEEYLVFASRPENLRTERLQRFFRGLHLKRVRKRIRCRMIAPVGAREEIKKIVKDLPLVEARFTRKVALDTVIYGNYVVVSAFGDKPINFEMHCKDVADNFRELFLEFWKNAKA